MIWVDDVNGYNDYVAGYNAALQHTEATMLYPADGNVTCVVQTQPLTASGTATAINSNGNVTVVYISHEDARISASFAQALERMPPQQRYETLRDLWTQIEEIGVHDTIIRPHARRYRPRRASRYGRFHVRRARQWA